MWNQKMTLGEWYNGQWYQYTPAATLEDEGTLTDIPEDFRYKQFVDDQGIRYPIPGMRTSQGLSITIETTSDLPFKEMDKIKFPDGSILRIKSVSDNRARSNSMASFQFPGSIDEYKSTVIIFNS